MDMHKGKIAGGTAGNCARTSPAALGHEKGCHALRGFQNPSPEFSGS
jgi:hypothetical protein